MKVMLDKEQTHIMEQNYLAHAVAADQLRRVPEILDDLFSVFDRITDIMVTKGDLIRYIIEQRKSGDWVKLGQKAKKLNCPFSGLQIADLEALKSFYCEAQVPLDEYLYSESHAEKLERAFRKFTGKIIDKWQLVAAMMKKRKRGEWVKLTDWTPPTAKPFEDIDEVA